jgi:DeoR/GlpR family transcriptional regulator of sugar metabolism
VTIRQDLNTLEKQSYLRRTHGFAVPLDSDDVETRMMNNYTVKRELADYAASLVSDGETVFIENGSCNALLARRLGEQRGITIITVSSYIAHLLKDALCDVILLGGIYQKKSESVVGPLTRQYVQQVHFSKAFIGIDGWLPDTGFTGRDMMRSDVVNAVLEKGNEAIVLTDSSKFGAVHPYTLGVGNCFNRDHRCGYPRRCSAPVAGIWPSGRYRQHSRFALIETARSVGLSPSYLRLF